MYWTQDEHWPADELNILIEVYNFKTTSLSLVENLFIEINSAEPVKAIDMPVGVRSLDKFSVLKIVIDNFALLTHFPER